MCVPVTGEVGDRLMHGKVSQSHGFFLAGKSARWSALLGIAHLVWSSISGWITR